MPQLIKEIKNDEAVSRKASAALGLLNIREYQIRTWPIIWWTGFTLRQYQGGPDQNIVYYWGPVKNGTKCKQFLALYLFR